MVRPDAVDYLQAGLKAASLRQSVIANNIANLHTPDFHRNEVRFETLLADAIKGDSAGDPDAVSPVVLHSMKDTPNGEGNDVDIEVEVGDMIKNSEMQKAYFRLLNKLMKQMELAIQD